MSIDIPFLPDGLIDHVSIFPILLSMADVTGLVIGVIALASLFSTCIDLFDRFELGRNYASDYQLACTKLCLLRARLSSWGLTLNVGTPGHEHPKLRRHWTEEEEVVGRTLLSIKEIFENAAIMSEKYQLTPARSRAFRSVVAFRANKQSVESDKTLALQTSTSSWALLRKRTVWAVHDKQKFDNFVQDLSFLVDNLEKVIERLDMPELPRTNMPATPPLSPPTQRTTKAPHSPQVEDRHVVPGSYLIGPAGHHVVPTPFVPSIQLSKPGLLPDPSQLVELARSMQGNVSYITQEVAGVSTMGNIGQDAPRTREVYVATQVIHQNGFVAHGNIGESFALKLHKQQCEHEQALKEASQRLLTRQDTFGSVNTISTEASSTSQRRD